MKWTVLLSLLLHGCWHTLCLPSGEVSLLGAFSKISNYVIPMMMIHQRALLLDTLIIMVLRHFSALQHGIRRVPSMPLLHISRLHSIFKFLDLPVASKHGFPRHIQQHSGFWHYQLYWCLESHASSCHHSIKYTEIKFIGHHHPSVVQFETSPSHLRQNWCRVGQFSRKSK